VHHVVGIWWSWCCDAMAAWPSSSKSTWALIHVPNNIVDKYESQLGWLFPIDGKIKVMFHTTNQMLIDLMSMWDHYECATSQCDIPSCNQQRILLPWLPADSFWVTLSSAHWCFGAWEITYK
jgi:hypothetical protein